MRLSVPVAVLASAALLVACGDDPTPRGPEPKVRLTLAAPADGATVRDETVTIRGEVAPARASVEVRGEQVPVEGGRFELAVELEPGANLIDVAASTRGSRPDFAVLRVVREVRVPVPELVGDDADSAREQLEGLGLEVEAENGGGLFDRILPGDPKVCATEPEAGAEVLPGSTVKLVTARDC